VPKLETIRELVKIAHAAGLPVLIHANSDEAQRFGLDAGVDIMAHGLWNWSQERSTSSELTQGIKKILDDGLAQNVGWQTTIQVLYRPHRSLQHVVSVRPAAVARDAVEPD